METPMWGTIGMGLAMIPSAIWPASKTGGAHWGYTETEAPETTFKE